MLTTNRLWLEGDAGSEQIEREREHAVDFGTYEVAEGSIEAGAMDLGFTGKVLAGPWRLSSHAGRWRLAPRGGVPASVPSFVQPMLAESRTTIPRGGEWMYELKLDGYRVEAAKAGDTVKLYSRCGNDLTADYPSVVTAVTGIAAESALLDGEVVAVDGQGRRQRQAVVCRQGAERFHAEPAREALEREASRRKI